MPLVPIRCQRHYLYINKQQQPIPMSQSNYHKVVYMQQGKYVEVLMVHLKDLPDYKELMRTDPAIKGGYARNEGDGSVTWLKR